MKKILFILAVLFYATNSYAKTTIKLLELPASPSKSEGLHTLLEEFEIKNPDIEIEVISIPWGLSPEEILEKMSGEDAPDIMEMPDHWLSLFADGELLLNLEDKIKNWPDYQTLEPYTMDIVHQHGEIYTMPYGLYLRALYYNKKILKQAGIEKPPHTMAELSEALEAISTKTGKAGYCLRGGLGGIHAWMMYSAIMNGSNSFFTDDGKSRINEPDSIKGLQFVLDLYQKGYTPKESINWGFKEVVTNFGKGNCGFLDQDPDALGLILNHMDKEDLGVVPMPVGHSGKSFPTLDFGGWSILRSAKNSDAAWRLIQFLLEPVNNLQWVEQIGILPIHINEKNKDYLSTELLSAWNKELNDETYEPAVMPIYLSKFGIFARNIVINSSHEAMMGKRTAKEIADLWAEYLTKEYANYQRKVEEKQKQREILYGSN